MLNINPTYLLRKYSTQAFDFADYYRRHILAKAHISAGLEPSLAIISRVLQLSVPITQGHLDLCESIVKNLITMPLPKPNTEHVTPFANVAGPEVARTPEKAVPGCYRLHGPDTTSCYAGQGIHLGGRVKDHAKGHNTNTASFVESLGTTGLVDLFILPKNINLDGLTLQQFLTVLEQYLFFVYHPNQNKSLVASPGVLQSPAAIQQQRKDKGTPLFVYLSDAITGALSLLFVFDSRGMVGPTFGFGRE